MIQLNPFTHDLEFDNSNGKTYKVVAFNALAEVMVLEEDIIGGNINSPKYILAKYVRPHQDSWGSGVYDLTLSGALNEFEKFVRRELGDLME